MSPLDGVKSPQSIRMVVDLPELLFLDEPTSAVDPENRRAALGDQVALVQDRKRMTAFRFIHVVR